MRVYTVVLVAALLLISLSTHAREYKLFSGLTYVDSETSGEVQFPWGETFDFTASGWSVGYQVSFQSFAEEALYFGAYSHRSTGEYELCFSNTCTQYDRSSVQLGLEVGWAMEGWVPFGGLTQYEIQTSPDFGDFSLSGSGIQFGAGTWYHFSQITKAKFKLSDLTDTENRTVSGGFQHQLDNGFTIGATLKLSLSEVVSGLGLLVEVGRTL